MLRASGSDIDGTETEMGKILLSKGSNVQIVVLAILLHPQTVSRRVEEGKSNVKRM